VLLLLFSIHAHTLSTAHKTSTIQSHHILLITMFPPHTPQNSTFDSPSRRGSVPTMSLVPPPESPSRRLSIPTLPLVVPTNAMTSTPLARDYLPFHFGTEFELPIRPKNIANLEQGLQIPEFDAPVRETRQFNLALLRVVANLLSGADMPSDVYDQGSDVLPDYSRRNVTLDGSLTKKHICLTVQN
jgi:hypothetical protein